jgi:dimethylhistidine N-methyltransferase
LLLDACPQLRLYVPMDISETPLQAAAHAVGQNYRALKIAPVVGDFTHSISLPAEALGYPAVGFFPGSTIGNFSPDEARDFLRRSRRALGSASTMIIGADLAKSRSILLPAYDDSLGVTAAFNKNLLTRLNREFDADFEVDNFVHRAIWNERESRMEMHLMSLYPQVVSVGSWMLEFQAGETIHTENSYKYEPAFVAELAQDSGWQVAKSWISDSPEFGIFLLSA